MRSASLRAAWMTWAALVLAAAPAWAGPSAKHKDEARVFAQRGYELLEAGEYVRAIESFQSAEDRFHAPTHYLYIARAEVKLGRLLAAERSYEKVLSDKLGLDAPQAYREAQASAKAEIVALRARIPSIVIKTSGGVAAKVALDGKDLGATELGGPVRVDPGAHLVVVTNAEGARFERAIEIESGRDAKEITIDLAPKVAMSAAPGIVLVVVGAAGVGVGAAMEVMIHAQKPADVTPFRIAEIAGFAAGGAMILGGGIYLGVRSARQSKAPAGAGAHLVFGPGSIGVRGRF